MVVHKPPAASRPDLPVISGALAHNLLGLAFGSCVCTVVGNANVSTFMLCEDCEHCMRMGHDRSLKLRWTDSCRLHLVTYGVVAGCWYALSCVSTFHVRVTLTACHDSLGTMRLLLTSLFLIAFLFSQVPGDPKLLISQPAPDKLGAFALTSLEKVM